MELDSDGEEQQAPAPPAPSTTSAAAGDDQTVDEVLKVENDSGGIVEEDMDMEDEDMEMSSPIRAPPVPLVPEPSPPPRSPQPFETASTPTPAAPVPSPAVDDEDAHAAQAVRNAQRRKIEAAIALTKAQLALRESALSSRPSLVSSSGSSESPDPPTPVDSPHVSGIEVAVASENYDVAMVGSDPAQAADVVVKTESAAITLDDLAISFITESIQTVSASSSSSSSSTALSQPPPGSSTTMLASMQLATPTPIRRPNAIPIIAPVPTPKVTLMQPPAAPMPLTEEQKQTMRKKWLDLVEGSKTLMEKIAAAKSKEEKSLLMRMLKAKTKVADELKREIDSGFALATTTTTMSSTATSSSLSSLSATPTPVPYSRTPSVTPVPTPSGTPIPTSTPGYGIAHKWRPSSPTGTTISMFRWPETAREMMIVVSDDEAD